MLPKHISYSLRYNDDSGDKLCIEFDKTKRHVAIRQGDNLVYIELEDLAWFQEAYSDINAKAEDLRDGSQT